MPSKRRINRPVHGLNEHRTRPGDWLRDYWPVFAAVALAAVAVMVVVIIIHFGGGQAPTISRNVLKAYG